MLTDKASEVVAEDGASVQKDDGAPELAASSSSEDSQLKEKTLSWTEMLEESQPEEKVLTWTEKITSECALETACGTSEPWRKEVYDTATNTWTTVSTRASGLIDALGSAARNPNLINELSAKAQELKNTVATTALSLHSSVMSTQTAQSNRASVTSTQEKLTTDVDTKAMEEITPIMSITTEHGTPNEEQFSSWNLWKQVENLIHKVKLPESIGKFKFLSSVCSQMEPKDKLGKAKEEENKEDIKEAPTVEEAAPMEEAAPAPGISKIDSGSGHTVPW